MNFIVGLLADTKGQVPSTLTDNYDALLTTTLRAMQPDIKDNITKGNVFLAYLKSRDRFRKQDGGERVKVPLMHAHNSGADIYDGYGVLQTAPTDGITSAFYDWAQLSVPITISGKERKQNKGKHAAISLLQAKTEQSMASIMELLNNCLVSGKISSGTSSAQGQFVARTGTIDTSAAGPLPLTALIDVTATRSSAIGNINPNTYAFWANQARASSATSFALFKQDIARIYNNCGKGVGGNPDLMLGDQIGWETYYNSLQAQERFVVNDSRTVDMLAGSDALAYRKASFIWDEIVPDPDTNADVVDAIGSMTTSTIYFINSASMVWMVEADTDFVTTPFVRPENQDASVAQILWMGAIGVNNRRKNGVLSSISRTITA